jgi:hypothetical protein
LSDHNTIQLDSFGIIRHSNAYGADYLSEFRRVITAFASPGPRKVLEWGMGNSTQFFIEERDAMGLGGLISIDHSAEYFAALLESLPKWDGFRPFCLDLVGPKISDRDPEFNYGTFPLSLNARFDIIFIDGRRRMECAYTAAQLCGPDTIVILHDYRRARYQGVCFLFDVVEDGSQFRCMKLKPQLLLLRSAKWQNEKGG